MAWQLPRRLLSLLPLLGLALSLSAATTRNDDSCDIAVLPAATLLLPYFEVDVDDPQGETTLVTITNVTHLDAIARVTLWTDRGYPLFTFNVALTGYDVYALNLYDILGNGQIAANTRPLGPRGQYSDPNPDVEFCSGTSGTLTDATRARLRAALTTGTIEGECNGAGGVHENAIGYATIDVVGNCSTNTPRDRAYWNTDLRYDNILLGDYQQVSSAGNLAQGGPLVHIRAIPEGGTPRSRRPSDEFGFTRTFYSRFQTAESPTLDARQPLPSQFAAQWTEGTSLKIWREGRAGANATCADFAADMNLAVADIVTFDDQENAIGLAGDRLELTAATKTDVDGGVFPQLMNGAGNGWIYLNLDRSQRDEYASQAWVVASTRVEGRYSADVDAIPLANGCTAPAEPEAPIAPNHDDEGSCDIALLPAATLLLPYFEVNLDDPLGQTTVFTITNASAEDRIARVTLWTDYAFPVLTFNIYLTGYDVQSINLFDVLQRGLIAPDQGTGTMVTRRGPLSERNFAVDLGACGRLPGLIDHASVVRMQNAFTEGIVPDFGVPDACYNVGYEHDNAIGYATIDVVKNCDTNNPTTAEYWTDDIAYDNVLIGDYHQLDPSNDSAQGSTLVHIRAVRDAGFPRTFYSRFQPPATPRLDARQPLPSVIATRWIEGGNADYRTYLKIWREGTTGRDTQCHEWDQNTASFAEAVRFDENENAVADLPERAPSPIPEFPILPATSLISVNDGWIFPLLGNGSVGGWMYLNMDDHLADGVARQAWIVTTMRAEGRFSVDMDAAAMGNGCSGVTPYTETTIGTEPLGPRP